MKALAVDVEPTVFWNGDSITYGADVIAWRESTGFIEGDEPGEHGHIDPLPPAANGSSGKKVEKLYLEPLNISGTETAFTDIYPAFVIKHSNSKRREQGDAIQQEYNEIAEALAMPRSSLSSRPPATKLPNLAVDRFGPRVLADMQAADAPLVITLGNEVFQTLLALPKWLPRHLAPRPAHPLTRSLTSTTTGTATAGLYVSMIVRLSGFLWRTQDCSRASRIRIWYSIALVVQAPAGTACTPSGQMPD